jgi:hypothetical protein
MKKGRRDFRSQSRIRHSLAMPFTSKTVCCCGRAEAVSAEVQSVLATARCRAFKQWRINRSKLILPVAPRLLGVNGGCPPFGGRDFLLHGEKTRLNPERGMKRGEERIERHDTGILPKSSIPVLKNTFRLGMR